MAASIEMVSVVFTDLVDSTAIASRLGPEAAETLELVADMCKDPEHAGLKSRAQALLGALKTKMAAK